MEFLDFINDVLTELNITGVDAIGFSVISLITILLFKYFYNSIDAYKKKENDEINKSLEIFQNVLISIKKHDANIISTEELYYESMNLIAICSMKLKTVILDVDIKQTNELENVKVEIRKEFNSLKYDQNTICKRYTESVVYSFSYMLRNSGFFNIFIAILYTFVTFITLFTCVSLLFKLNTLNTVKQIVLIVVIISFVIYFFLFIAMMEVLVTKKFKRNMINILALICVCILPFIFILKVNIITTLIFSIITVLYALFAYPNSIRKEE
jgi:hypothetical protein